MQASHFLAAMQKQRAPHDVISYNSTISACERGGEWQLASNLFRGIWGNGRGNEEVRTSHMRHWKAMKTCVLLALRLVAMPGLQVLPSEISYNSVISANSEANWRAAIGNLHWKSMKGHTLTLNVPSPQYPQCQNDLPHTRTTRVLWLFTFPSTFVDVWVNHVRHTSKQWKESFESLRDFNFWVIAS